MFFFFIVKVAENTKKKRECIYLFFFFQKKFGIIFLNKGRVCGFFGEYFLEFALSSITEIFFESSWLHI